MRGRLRRLDAAVTAVRVGVVARHLDLDVPLLLEAAHRERHQEELDRDEEERQQAEQRGVERRVAEAGLVAIEPGRASHRGDHREEDREARGHGEHAAVPAAHVERHPDVDGRQRARDDLRALELRPAADHHHEDQSGADQQQQDDDGLGGLGLRFVPVWMHEDRVGHRGHNTLCFTGLPRYCGRAGTGRQSRFRSWCSKERGGSSPSARISTRSSVTPDSVTPLAMMGCMADVRNPFRFGSLALDEAFTDRDDEIAEIEADVRNGQDVVLFAPRRYGKSSLVWRVAQRLVRKKVLVAQVDLMTTPTKERLAEKLAKTIYEDVASPLLRVKERLRVFQNLRIQPTVTVDPADGSLSFGFAAGLE